MNNKLLPFECRFTEQYSANIMKSSAKLQVTSDDVRKMMSETARSSFKEYLFQYLVAASVSNETIIAWYNGQPLHSAALSLDLVHNALIKMVFGDSYSIHVTNKPFPFLPENNTIPVYHYDSFGGSFPIVIGIILLMISSSYVTYHIKVCII